MNRSQVEKAIQRQHPEGWVSQMGSAKLVRPETRPQHLEGEGRQASVMLLIYPSNIDGSLHTVLTRRKDDLQHHPGQISLPGGSRDEGESIEQTARREVEEEIGVDRDSIEILGRLNSVYVPPSDFTVIPFVGWLAQEPKFAIQDDEVAELIRVSIARLVEPSIRRFSSVDTDAKEREVPWFSIGGQQVWGATAIILDDFIQRLNCLTLRE